MKVKRVAEQFYAWGFLDQTAVHFDGTNIFTSVYLKTTNGNSLYRDNLTVLNQDLEIEQDFKVDNECQT